MEEDFFAYYLYRGYSLYAENEEGYFHYDRAEKKFFPVVSEWNPADMEGIEVISVERAQNFLS